MTVRSLFALVMAGAVCSIGAAADPIQIGSRLELLVDDYLIENMSGAELTLHRPTAREVAITHKEPWEGAGCAYYTVFQDGDVYRMYYRGTGGPNPQTGKPRPQVTCYAESRDGINWTKPEFGVVEFEGSKKNNIVWQGYHSHNFTPFLDTNPACKPDEKYKALGGDHPRYGLYAFKSPDGIHWSPMSDKPVLTEGWFDSQNLAFWDPLRGCYVEFHRDFRGEGDIISRKVGGDPIPPSVTWHRGKHPLLRPGHFRDVMTSTTTDFLHWPTPVWLQYPGAPREHLYTNAVLPYYRAPHIYVGFPMRFVSARHSPRKKGAGDGLFMTSRDGVHFKRWGEAFVRPGLQKERWARPRNNYTAWGLLVTKSSVPGMPDELSIYSTEGYHGDERLRRYTLRIDGFVSVAAPLKGGEMVTKPLVFKGKQLVMNYSTSAAGSIQVEVQAADGQPIKGFALADCPEIFGDELQRVVSWKGGSDVSQLAGKPARLRFVMKDADLYSIRFH